MWCCVVEHDREDVSPCRKHEYDWPGWKYGDGKGAHESFGTSKLFNFHKLIACSENVSKLCHVRGGGVQGYNHIVHVWHKLKRVVVYRK